MKPGVAAYIDGNQPPEALEVFWTFFILSPKGSRKKVL